MNQVEGAYDSKMDLKPLDETRSNKVQVSGCTGVQAGWRRGQYSVTFDGGKKLRVLESEFGEECEE
jgi:hypothetical protein